MTELKGGRADAFLNKPDPKVKAALIHGSDEGLVRERARALVKAVAGTLDDPFNVVRLEDDALGSDPGLLADEAQAISLMGGRRVVWVRGAGSGLARAAAAYLPDAPGDALIVAEAGTLRKGDKLRKLFEAQDNAVAMACYADGAGALRTLIVEQLRGHGLAIAADALERLQAQLGGDRQLSRAEVEKLALYCEGAGEVTLEDVDAICGEASALALDDLIDAVFEGDLEGADTRFGRFLATGMPAATVIVAAANHAAALQRLKAKMTPGQSADAVVRGARPPIFFKRQASVARQLSAWDLSSLLAASDTLGEAELKTREFASLAEAIASRALLSLARSARTARYRRV